MNIEVIKQFENYITLYNYIYIFIIYYIHISSFTTKSHYVHVMFFQPSPSTSSLSSNHSGSHNVNSSAPSSNRGDSVQQSRSKPFSQRLQHSYQHFTALPHLLCYLFSFSSASPLPSDKHKHTRDNACLSPRDRLCSGIFPNPMDPSQVRTPAKKHNIIGTLNFFFEKGMFYRSPKFKRFSFTIFKCIQLISKSGGSIIINVISVFIFLWIFNF